MSPTDVDKDPAGFDKACAGKEQYTSESAAMAALKAFRKEGVLRKGGTLSAYPCNFCSHWHLGH